MNILVDTHYLLWAFIDTGKIEEKYRQQLVSEENLIFCSQASLWEISIKYNHGKLLLGGITPEEFYREISDSHFKCKLLENEELISFHQLPIEHKDPFDRIMVWQCIRSEMHFLSVDLNLDCYQRYGLKTLS